jgi:hypothetical protein
MRKIIATAILAAGLLVAGATAATADPDFGPGNSSKGPNDGGAKCQTAEHGEAPSPNQDDEPGCKGN